MAGPHRRTAIPPTPVQYTQGSGVLPWGVPQTLRDAPGVLAEPVPSTPGAVPDFGSSVPVVPVQGYTWEVLDRSRFPVVTSGVIAVPTQSVLLISRPDIRRLILGLRNSSPAGIANLFVDFGTNASANSWLQLVPGQTLLLDAVVPQNDVYGVADAAGGQLSFIYANAS